MFKLRTLHQGCLDVSCTVWTAVMCLPNLHFMLCWVVLTHNVTPKLCTEYLVRLVLTNLDWVSTVCWHTMLPLSCVGIFCQAHSNNIKSYGRGIYSCVDHNVTPKLCTEYFVRRTLTNLDWVSTMVCWHTSHTFWGWYLKYDYVTYHHLVDHQFVTIRCRRESPDQPPTPWTRNKKVTTSL